MFSARDVEIAIRGHDYNEAMRALKARYLQVAFDEPITHAEVALILRPSVGMAAAVTDDEEALGLIERIAAVFAGNAPARQFALMKAAANWHSLETVRWVNEVISRQDGLAVEQLEERALQQGHLDIALALRMLARQKVLYIHDGCVYRGIEPDEDSPARPSRFSTRQTMDEIQLAFYEDTFKPAFLRGERIDVDARVSYCGVVLGELATEYGYEDLTRLRTVFLSWANLYPESWLSRIATAWVADTFFLAGEYQSGYDFLIKHGSIEIDAYIGIAEVLVDSRVTGAMACGWTTANRLTRYGHQHWAEVLKEVEHLLDEEHAKRGRSVVVDLWHAVAVDRAPMDSAPAWVELAVEGQITADHLGDALRMMKIYGGRKQESFRGLTAPSSPSITWPSASAVGLATYSTYGFHLILRAYLHNVFRAAEDTVRAKAGVPLVGKGWVSEVSLFHQLRDAFPETRVVHQARPKWLGQQSLDILFPEWNVAVEYQGEQHHRSVDLFGGERAFIAQQERDARKRHLCATNGLSLIEVFPKYAVEHVIAQVKTART